MSDESGLSDQDAGAQPGDLGDDDVQAVRRTIKSVCHDLSNPLSIIAGNAQLLGEIAASMDLGHDIRDSLKDIERAVEQMSEQLERLSELNSRLIETPTR